MNMNCLHCDIEFIGKSKFCCNGCEQAYEIINDSGFNLYYKNRLLKTNIKSLKPEETILEISNFISTREKIHSVHLMVEGLHCASCIWLIENILKNKQESKRLELICLIIDYI